MSAPNSEPSDSFKGDESNKLVNGAKELNAESSNELDSDTPQTIREILNYHGNILNDHGNILTQLQKQNIQLKEIVTDQHIQMLDEINKLHKLFSRGESLKETPEAVKHSTVEESSTSKKDYNGISITRHTEESPKVEKPIIDVNDSDETPITSYFDRKPLAGKSKANPDPTANPQLYTTSSLPAENATEDKPSTSSSVYVESDDKDKSEIKIQSGSIAASYSVDVIDKNTSKKTVVVAIKSQTNPKTLGSATTNKMSPKPTATNELRESQGLDVFQSHLETIKEDWARLQRIFEEGMFPNIKSLIDKDEHEKKFGYQSVNNTTIKDIDSKILATVKERENTESTSKTIPDKLCFLCNKVATLPPCKKCSSDKELSNEEIPAYCGKAHQDLHQACGHDNTYCGLKATERGWKEVRGTDGINNGLPYYVATRDLQAGHNIFTKKPLLTFPKLPAAQGSYALGRQFPLLLNYSETNNVELCTCIVCYELMMYGELIEDPLHGIRLNKCPLCGWPVHSPSTDPDAQNQCKTSCQTEHAIECKIFLDNNWKWNKGKNLAILYLGALRAVLNTTVRKKLLNLPLFERCNPYIKPHAEYIKAAHKLLRPYCKKSEVSDKELNKIIRVIPLNTLPSSAAYPSIRKQYTHTIYEGGHTGRILPHDCNPNCSILVNPITGEATFKTRRTVKRDEILTINYVVDAFPQPIDQRALALANYQICPCSCSKCKDGRDVTSAMKQKQSETQGVIHNKGCFSEYLMPYSTRLQESEQIESKSNQDQPNAHKQDQEKHNFNNLYIWQCPSCKSDGPFLKQRDVDKLVDGIREELREPFWALKYNGLDTIAEIIKKHSDVDFHPDHSIMVLAQVALGYITVGQMREKKTSSCFDDNRRVDYGTYFPKLDKAIKVLTGIDNGRSEMYGILLYHHSLLRMRHLAPKIKTPKKKTENKTALESIINKLEESWEIMQNNPYLSAIEICRDISLFELYVKEIENPAKHLLDSCKGSSFKTFRAKQKESLQIGKALPNIGYWNLCRVSSFEGSYDAIRKMSADFEAADTCPIQVGNMVKMEFKARINEIFGAFISVALDSVIRVSSDTDDS